MNFNQVGDGGMKFLLPHKWSKLKEFHLRGNNIGNNGVSSLVVMNIPSLQKLVLGDNKITSDGCKVLAKGQWRQLKFL